MSSLTICKRMEFQREFTCRYTPQQNGVVEQKNRHIAEIARALVAEKSLPHSYWAEVVSTTIYIMNRTPTAAIHDVMHLRRSIQARNLMFLI